MHKEQYQAVTSQYDVIPHAYLASQQNRSSYDARGAYEVGGKNRRQEAVGTGRRTGRVRRKTIAQTAQNLRQAAKKEPQK